MAKYQVKTLEQAKKWKMAAPPPEVEIYARLRGIVQFQCPDCGNLNHKAASGKKQARIHCRRCKHKFRIGLAFYDTILPPLAFYLGTHTGFLVNKLNPTEDWTRVVGRPVGMMDFQCPDCSKPHSVQLDWDFPTAICCKVWNVSLLLYTSGKAPKLICPFDWVVIGTKIHENETLQPISPPQADQIQ